ncbi:recombination protein RecR [Candidatus Shapirobacteria bacterium CG09_land_8_20_14_0_10_39_12]|uniref:Recombination protein RecR n=1 Tax=Candidatus Shapirobacteria bacterium CG09_land_8_20_14_0_10_39_12 TaxID=1974885 RepID=A0A2H0WPL1_9BACT|nr:MAG: recombination protein RecR [Candidatus Shapirobacteria bacterium CG09_land_8_20_14_0_10_39_12]
MQVPKAIQNLIDSFERLPGIGPKTAQRLTFYLLHVPQTLLDGFASSLQNLKKNTVLCSICFNVAEKDPCPICSDTNRDHSTICVVEQPLDVLAFDKNGHYKGLYHVLHGAISPLNNIGPDEIKIKELLERVSTNQNLKVSEIILATNSNMEGEATSMYIAKELKELFRISNFDIRISRLAHGLPVGGDVEYADEVTLQRALEGRREYGI